MKKNVNNFKKMMRLGVLFLCLSIICIFIACISLGWGNENQQKLFHPLMMLSVIMQVICIIISFRSRKTEKGILEEK
jgi:hypothetical protein